MKKLKNNLSNLLICLCEIVVGVLLLINPIGYTSGIIIIFGIFLALNGIISVISHFRISAEDAVRDHSLALGLIEIAGGLFCILRSSWFIATFPVLTLLYGVVLLAIGFEKLQWMIDLLRLKKRQWFLALISAAVSILGAVIIFMHPLESTAFLWVYTAITLIVEAVLDIITIFFRSRKTSEPAAN
ncbi:MAG: DUF308 domain-containing protein [Oscillospiraceae bacterium]|nr:DUF308 domain-containing protein [Oscillospiraceae bacterium]